MGNADHPKLITIIIIIIIIKIMHSATRETGYKFHVWR
jgi:hypothetical protein